MWKRSIYLFTGIRLTDLLAELIATISDIPRPENASLLREHYLIRDHILFIEVLLQ